ncbi:uncharacterized protein LOC135200683 [Macrobrachium nipponense]|uniref:uncharacterized protein LOC135200683 n=1 Tax=Macrobrachium nipponense TaxID=159736 RepID=UPI0030C876F4
MPYNSPTILTSRNLAFNSKILSRIRICTSEILFISMKWLISSLQCVLLLMYADSLEVGDFCSSNDQCGDLKECRFGRCTCSANANMIPVFSSISTQSGTICSGIV